MMLLMEGEDEREEHLAAGEAAVVAHHAMRDAETFRQGHAVSCQHVTHNRVGIHHITEAQHHVAQNDARADVGRLLIR